MAFDYVVKITDYTAGTVTLTASPWAIRDPDLHAADRDEASVVNTLTVRLTDGSVSANLAEVRTLNGLLHQAHRRGQGEKDLAAVYVVWQESATGSEWRSEILDGRAEWDAEALTWTYWQSATQFADVVIERRNHWDGPEAQLPLTNPNGVYNTAGLNVYNDNSGAGTYPNTIANYADILGSAIGGDLPGPVRLEITNTYATARLYDVWVGVNQTNPSFTHYLAGPGAVTVASGGTVTIKDWTLTGYELTLAAGREYRVLARFGTDRGVVGGLLARFRLSILWNVTTLWESGWVTPDTTRGSVVRDLGSLRLPPWIPGLTGLDGVTLRLSALQTDVASMDINLTWLQLVCADAWRYITCVGYGVVQGRRIVDDGINERLYTDDGSGGAKAGILTGGGSSALTLQPGKNARLMFAMHANTLSTAELDRSISVKTYYRPRRLTL